MQNNMPNNMDEQLQLQVMVNDAAAISYLPDNRCKITLPLRSDGWRKTVCKLFRLPHEKSFELDDLGTEILSWCNGRMTFGKMVENYRQRWKLTFFEAHALLIQFFAPLAKNNIVVFVGKGNN